MTDESRMQLLTVSGFLLFGIMIAIACRCDAGRVMTGDSVEKWLLIACIFFYSLFTLVGVHNGNVAYCRCALTVFLVGLAVYYGQKLGSISKSTTSVVLSAIGFIIVLILVSPLAGHMVHLRAKMAQAPAAALHHPNDRPAVAAVRS